MAPLVPAAWKSLEHLPESQLEPFAHGHMGHGVVVINHAQLQLFMALPHPHCHKTLSCGFAQECEIEFLLVPSQMSNMSQPIPARLAHVPHLRGLHVPLLLLSWHWSYKRRVPRSWRRWRRAPQLPATFRWVKLITYSYNMGYGSKILDILPNMMV